MKTSEILNVQPNVWNRDESVPFSDSFRNPNSFGMELKLETSKSERSDFGRLLYVASFSVWDLNWALFESRGNPDFERLNFGASQWNAILF